MPFTLLEQAKGKAIRATKEGRFMTYSEPIVVATLLYVAFTFVAAIAAVIAARKAFKDLKVNRAQLDQLKLTSQTQVFSALLKETADDDARFDRSQVWQLKESLTPEEIQKLVDKGRDLNLMKQKKQYTGAPIKVNEDALKGIAIERTIARLDRVAFFLLGDREVPMMEPPSWLRNMFYETWQKLSNWINYERKHNKVREHYADYLEKFINTCPPSEAKGNPLSRQDKANASSVRTHRA